MNSYPKKFIGTIYLKDEKAVASLTDDTIVAQDPVSFSVSLSDSNADEIMIFDLSPAGVDAAHEKAIDLIKDICKAVDVPVTAAGNVKRMEDIKKLLYAGCKKACLNYSKEGNRQILKEVSDKFGKDKIGICISSKDELSLGEFGAEEYASELFLIGNSFTTGSFAEYPLPVSLLSDDAEKLPDEVFLENTDISGLLGNVISKNAGKIDICKERLLEKGIKICMLEPAFKWESLKKNSEGMVPVIVQDYRTDQVLMLAYMNEEAYNKTLQTGKMTYFSRSRNQLWLKGETSSHFQYVKSLYADCDLDTILAKVKQVGAACHTGSYSCFFNEIASKEYDEKNPQKVLDSVFEVIKDRKIHPREGSYTNYLYEKGIDKILKKVGEEATEMVIAAKNPGSNEIVYEMSDFLYHMMVLMAEKNVSWEDVTDELSRR
jgi:phosphoribosyl-ATP pyrophosphohydrolase/phosphoribosyl-AMP cyclohydrolase